MPPGAILVFYTDGLTDRRTRADGSGHYTEDEAVQMLQHAVRAAAASGDADAVATAAEYAVPGDIDDDMAILVVQSSPSELASAERTFPAEPIMVSEARRLAAQTFRSWGMDPGQAELACLLVSEVVTNAVLHASTTPSPGRDLDLEVEPLMVPAPVGVPAGPASRAVPAGQILPGPVPSGRTAARAAAVPPQQATGPEGWVGAPTGAPAAPREFRLRLRRGAASVWVEVFDPDLRLPRIRTAGETDEGGRGLYLVEQLATRWGSRPTPEGKAVWFEMPRSGDRP
jgi:anti-sigma regulatory factor (Ser/Thr protein kinase)